MLLFIFTSHNYRNILTTANCGKSSDLSPSLPNIISSITALTHDIRIPFIYVDLLINQPCLFAGSKRKLVSIYGIIWFRCIVYFF